MKANQNLLEKDVPKHLDEFFTTALAKLKKVFLGKNTLTGIQFYGDLDD